MAEESGGYFPDVLDMLEENPFLRLVSIETEPFFKNIDIHTEYFQLFDIDPGI